MKIVFIPFWRPRLANIGELAGKNFRRISARSAQCRCAGQVLIPEEGFQQVRYTSETSFAVFLDLLSAG